MKQDNFLFVDIVSSIFLLILLLGNFLGLMYLSDANFLISLVASLFVVICYYFILQLLKRNKERMANKGYKDSGMWLFLVFILFGVFSFVCITHLYNIETNVKGVIQKEAKTALDEVTIASYSYDTIANDALQTFEAKFKNKLQGYKNTRTNNLRNELSNPPYQLPESILNSPSRSIDVAASTNAILQGYKVKARENKKEIDSLYINKLDADAKSILAWDRMNISQSYANLSKHLEAIEKNINAKINELPAKKKGIEFNKTMDDLPLNNPIRLAKLFRPEYLLPAIAVIVMHLFILIPFFTYKIRMYSKSTTDNNTSSGSISL
ncbi:MULTISPECIES: hypothetical protein [unclassified Sphingobacterium]|uniref:hypothetical protein n=1 Tax=unclassified Sphingobacterium TaxID=2609468 RepID=UPI00265D067D|nr:MULTISPECIES: hypothetical protein [unclassified Sphingobacterium]WKK60380.1 hypothetical protein QYC40_09075 [Sphingobacterium sp. BN32]